MYLYVIIHVYTLYIVPWKNIFNFIRKILGHILKFFLGEGAYTLFDVNPHLLQKDPD